MDENVGAIVISPKLRRLLLALNRELAAVLGMDGRYTVSTNVARSVSSRTGMPFALSKFLFHAGVAAAVAAVAHTSGRRKARSALWGALVLGWLESFDGSRKTQ